MTISCIVFIDGQDGLRTNGQLLPNRIRVEWLLKQEFQRSNRNHSRKFAVYQVQPIPILKSGLSMAPSFISAIKPLR
jgi:hypothetical protein